MRPKRRVIVLEGPDGSGKSTLAVRLSQAFGWPVVHTGGPIHNDQDYWARVDSMTHEPVIYDRHPGISQPVYGFLGWDGISFDQGVQGLQRTMPAAIIYCRLSDPKKMLASVLETKKAHKPPEYLKRVQENHERIVDRYDSEFNQLKYHFSNIRRYDWEHDNGELFNWLRERLGGAV